MYIYCYITEDLREYKELQKVFLNILLMMNQNMKITKYGDLSDGSYMRREKNKNQSKKRNIETYRVNKVCLSCDNYKK